MKVLKRAGSWVIGWALPMMVVLGCVGPLKQQDQGLLQQFENTSIQSYQLGPNDRISIEVFDEPDLMTKTTVSGHGTIKFPFLGELRVTGMTVKEVEEELVERLQSGYLKNPKVTVAITKFRNFFVSGEAKKPGAFPYQEGITVLKAITLAGGWTDRASKGQAQVLRIVKGEQQLLSMKMNDLIHPDDILIVPESFF